MTEQDPLQLLRDATHADEEDLAAMRRRFPADLADRPAEPLRRSRWPAVAAALFAAAGVALWLGAQPEPAPVPAESPEPVAAAPVAVDITLAQGVVDLPPGIRLTADGQGRVTGTDHNAVVRWESGHLLVEVDPKAEVRLAVHTDEGEVEVLGTVFTVDRDEQGTAVALERGKVEVRCLHGDSAILAAGQSHSCLPLTPGKALHNARQLTDPAAQLAATEVALDLARPGSAIEGELRVLRVQALQALGRNEEALSEAMVYIDLPLAPRRDEVCVRIDELGGSCP
jgi:ferric-dicitrate binding protein FerR (iron transport regulator)